MGTYFSEREFRQVESAENAFHSPIPTQVVSNGEFNPLPQTDQQKRVAARITELGDAHAKQRGLSRRAFLQSAG